MLGKAWFVSHSSAYRYSKYDLSFFGVCICIPCYISFLACLSPCQPDLSLKGALLWKQICDSTSWRCSIYSKNPRNQRHLFNLCYREMIGDRTIVLTKHILNSQKGKVLYQFDWMRLSDSYFTKYNDRWGVSVWGLLHFNLEVTLDYAWQKGSAASLLVGCLYWVGCI